MGGTILRFEVNLERFPKNEPNGAGPSRGGNSRGLLGGGKDRPSGLLLFAIPGKCIRLLPKIPPPVALPSSR